jgi:predicted Zn-ribbon and HTH transcriptional regulator
MSMPKAAMIELPSLRCLRCGWGPWIPRSAKRPDVCPKCKSRVWDKPPKFGKLHDLRAVQRKSVETFLEFHEKVDPSRVDQIMKLIENETRLALKDGQGKTLVP